MTDFSLPWMVVGSFLLTRVVEILDFWLLDIFSVFRQECLEEELTEILMTGLQCV